MITDHPYIDHILPGRYDALCAYPYKGAVIDTCQQTREQHHVQLNRAQLYALPLSEQRAALGEGVTYRGLVARAGDLRVWRWVLPAPCQMWSANDEHKGNEYDTARIRKTWRSAIVDRLTADRAPTGVQRVSFSIVFHFTTDGRRDALNYASTAKPIIDGFGPPFVQKPTAKKPAGAYSPGYGFIPDDTPRYVEDTSLSIGPLWQDVITADGWDLTLADVAALDRGWGGVTVVVGERPPLPDTPKRKRIPLAKVISTETRRRLALRELLG